MARVSGWEMRTENPRCDRGPGGVVRIEGGQESGHSAWCPAHRNAQQTSVRLLLLLLLLLTSLLRMVVVVVVLSLTVEAKPWFQTCYETRQKDRDTPSLSLVMYH